MQSMKAYYATQAVIRYYGAGIEPNWPDAPHVALANLRLERAALKMFTRRYGPLAAPPEKWSLADKLKLAIAKKRGDDPLWTVAVPRSRFHIADLERVTEMQRLLRNAWRNDSDAIVKIEPGMSATLWFGVTERRLGLKDAPADALTIFVDDFWHFIRAAFLIDYKAGRTAVCKNPDCPAPYFLRSRKGQEFCTHKCAVLINVRRFRELQRKASGTKNQQTQGRKRGRRTKP